jgi:tetratricopeptide (TPR) repeat protein
MHPRKPISATSTGSNSDQSRPNHWLSKTDAVLLLSKQASQAAKQQNYAQAISCLDRLIAYEPDNAEHFNNRGLMHYSLRDNRKALADYDQAIALAPELDKAYNNRANLHASDQNWAEAIADYDEAIDLNALNIRARLNQGITFREMGNYEEALICFDIALFFKPDNAHLHAERGYAHYLLGDWNCAIADYKAALSLHQTTHPVEDALTRRILKWMSKLELAVNASAPQPSL